VRIVLALIALLVAPAAANAQFEPVPIGARPEYVPAPVT
jgi:hypothetical protein